VDDYGIGRVVRSNKGRDKDKVFLVVAEIDEEYVLICDGSLRKIDNPKKKKIKHVSKMNIISDELKYRVEHKKKINNAFIRRELERLGVRPRSRLEV